MADTTRNIFSLSEYSDDTIAGEGISVDSVYVSPSVADNGYIGPGYVWPSNPLTTVSKITYGTDSIALIPSGDFPDSKRYAATFSSLTAGYITAGIGAPAPGHPSGKRNQYTYKFTYATETTARALPSGNANHPGGSAGLGNNGMGGVSNTEIAYTNNGDEHGTPSANYSKLYKFTFASETWASPGSFNEAWYQGGQGFGNQTYAYWAGGTPGIRSNVRRVTYSTDTMAYPPNLAATRAAVSASSDADAAYVFYGQSTTPSPSANPISTVIKLTYSTETSSILPSHMNDNARSNTSATGNLSNGYVTGKGYTTPAVDGNSSVSKFNYSTGTASNVGSNPQGEMSSIPVWSARMYAHPGSYPVERWFDGGEITPNNGYAIAGGSPMVSFTDRLNMSTDSVARVPGMGSYNPAWMVGTTMASSPNKGYYGGEYAGGKSSIWNIVYATDGREHNPSLNLAEGMAYFNSAGNANKGYVLGGYIAWPSPNRTLSRVSRMTYSTDSTSTIPGANIPAAPTPSFATGEGSAAFSSSGDESGAAYLTGGKEWPSQGSRSYIWKMSYPTETTTLLPARVPNTRTSAAAHSEKSAGYLTGGWTGSAPTSVLKFPWSTETFVEDGGDGMHRVGASTGNQQAAYVMGGISNITGSGTLAIKKFEYSTSTSSQISASLTGPGNRQGAWGTGALTNNLPSVPDAPTATPTPGTSPLADSAFNFGVAGGGDVIPGGTYTLFDKLEYSTETNSTLPSSEATIGTSGYTQRSITSQTEGWSNSANGTHLWKFVYATSTQNPSPASHTNRNHADGLTFSNKTEGYFGAGANVGTPGPSYSGGPANSLDKFTFSTSTISQVPDLSASPSNANHDFNTSNIGNQNAGYYSGGNSRSVGKYVYATSTSTMNNNFIAENSTNPMGVGNATNGYIVAGDRSSTDRIAYSTDTHTKLPAASYPPGDQTWGGGSHSSSDAGYIQGGRSPSAPNSPFNYHWSNTRKLTYSTETLSELPASADISVGRNDYSGMSARQNNNGSSSPAPNVI